MNRREFFGTAAVVAQRLAQGASSRQEARLPPEGRRERIAEPSGAGDLAADVAPWVFDVDGNGSVNLDDRSAIASNLGAVRGFAPRPIAGYDFRGDLLGRGQTTTLDLDIFDAGAQIGPVAPRPIVLCWHYGWYHPQRRVGEPTTATYLGGDYNSDDPVVEDEFNALKTEFGISADMLSWIDQPTGGFDPPTANYERGYFHAPSVGSRKFGWLYETTINLQSSTPMTLGEASGRRQRLLDNFRNMARMMTDSTTGALASNVLLIDGRPVIYMFASHLLGIGLYSLLDVAISLSRARSAFQEVAGVPPYLIGDEALFADDPGPDNGRRLRSSFFDAVTRYHHYDARVVAGFAAGGPVRLGGDYLDVVVGEEVRNAAAFEGIVNRFTGRPLLIIPSSAAGFAKRGFPTLHASRTDYARLLREMLAVADAHIARAHPATVGTPVLPAPLVIAGSWNEEFEGHALFPSAVNDAVVGEGAHGFEWLQAIKEVFGWNHYAVRSPAAQDTSRVLSAPC